LRSSSPSRRRRVGYAATDAAKRLQLGASPPDGDAEAACHARLQSWSRARGCGPEGVFQVRPSCLGCRTVSVRRQLT
jgi:hypothetical protein